MNKKGATKIGMFLSLLVALTAVIGLGPMVIGEEAPSGKVLLCHVPPGNAANTHTIAVKSDKVDMHLAHGDTLGECKGAEILKVDVCHVPPGNPDNAHTITVSDNALPAHLAHGDTEGACGAAPPVECPCFSEEDVNAEEDLVGVPGIFSPSSREDRCDINGEVLVSEFITSTSPTSGENFCGAGRFNLETRESTDLGNARGLTDAERKACTQVLVNSCGEALP